MSIALEACRIAEERVGSEQLPGVVTLALDVGTDAGVELENLEFCLEALLSQPPFRGAKAVINPCAGDVLRVSYLEVDDARASD